MAQQDIRDVVVIGAGPAGILAALHAAGKNRDVLLIDGGARPGQKILLSGGGRCNIVPEIVNPKAFVTESSPNTLRKILLSWPLDEVRAFLEKTIRLKLYLQKRTGKTFPVGGGEEAYERFHAALKRAKVTVRKGARVEDIVVESPFRLILRNKKEILARKVVVATGGCSYPETGSDGAGLEIARRLGHRVVNPYPALVPLLDSPRTHRRLAGISMDVHASARGESMRADFRGGFVFTHRGYSGPAVMNVSHVASRGELEGQHVPVTISWSEHTEEEWRTLLTAGSRTVRGVLKTIFADRFVDALVAELDLADARLATLRKEDRDRLIAALVSYRLPWQRTGGFDVAEVTGGGIDLSEVDPRTLESRRVAGLYFCGEILDAFGPIGGNNFLWAFVTGRLAGIGTKS